MYAQGPNYAQPPGYPAGSAYPGPARPSTQDSYNAPYDPYGDESPRHYPSGVRPRVDARDARMDTRPDPRAAEPRPYPVAEPRIDPRDLRDPRGDSRMLSSYSYPVTSPADVPMRGYPDDYASAQMQMGRGGGAYAPSRVVQTGYDSRESPQMRDTYRHEPIREERRSRR